MIYAGIIGFLVWTLLVSGLTWEAHTWKDGFEATAQTKARLDRVQTGQQAIIKSASTMAAIRKADTKPCALPASAISLLTQPTK
jgi:hypothetical protein